MPSETRLHVLGVAEEELAEVRPERHALGPGRALEGVEVSGLLLELRVQVPQALVDLRELPAGCVLALAQIFLMELRSANHKATFASSLLQIGT